MRRHFVILLLCLVVFPSFAEESTGSAAQLVRESVLKKDPNNDASSLGRLPKGTIMTLKGEQQNGFVEVEVELEEGSIQGWVLQKDINRRARGEDVEEAGDEKFQVDEGDEKVKRIRPRGKISVPKDEGLLLKRDSSFFYGVQAGGSYGILQSTSTDYMGIGITAGGHLGFFLDRAVPMRLEVGFTQLAGTSNQDVGITIGCVDAAASISYMIDRFELFGTLSFLYATGVSNLPKDINIAAAADLSNGYGGGGIGYVFPVGEVTDMAIRARYLISFGADPLANQLIALQFFFSFRG